jgi:hypothetical protein
MPRGGLRPSVTEFAMPLWKNVSNWIGVRKSRFGAPHAVMRILRAAVQLRPVGTRVEFSTGLNGIIEDVSG